MELSIWATSALVTADGASPTHAHHALHVNFLAVAGCGAATSGQVAALDADALSIVKTPIRKQLAQIHKPQAAHVAPTKVETSAAVSKGCNAGEGHIERLRRDAHQLLRQLAGWEAHKNVLSMQGQPLNLLKHTSQGNGRVTASKALDLETQHTQIAGCTQTL